MKHEEMSLHACERYLAQRRRRREQAQRRRRKRRLVFRTTSLALLLIAAISVLPKNAVGTDVEHENRATAAASQPLEAKPDAHVVSTPIPDAQTMSPRTESVKELPVNAVEDIAVQEPPTTFLGKFRITHYCACKLCCGKDENDPAYGLTATGTVVTEGRTIAVDPDVIPYGSHVDIRYDDGRVCRYIAEDCGGEINGAEIDIYIADHARAWEMGATLGSVYLVQEELL